MSYIASRLPTLAACRRTAVLAAAAFALCSASAAVAGRSKRSKQPDVQQEQSDGRSQNKPTARFDAVDATSFTISEQVRINGDARTAYDDAVRFLQQGQFQQGIDLLLKVTEAVPDVTAPYIDLGMAYTRIGDFAHAEAALKTAIELNPEHPAAYNELGLLYREMGRFADARTSYEKALAIYPGFHYAQRNLAILCDLYLNDLPCAITHYKAYSEAVPDDKEVTIWIADLGKRAGQ
jgi:tetratricopeptide (TPR) repeat protein